MRPGDEENEDPNRRRSSRARKQREANPCDFLDDDEEDDTASTVESESPSNSNGSTNASTNASNETRLARPTTYGRSNHWHSKKNYHEFSTVDGTDKITHTYRSWNGMQHTFLLAAGTLVKAEKALVAAQDPHDVALEITNFGSDTKMTQVPYHADLLPYYEYFADGIQRHSGVESLSIANFHLPPAPWFGDNILPTLETSSITELVLSNCSLAGEELASLANFLQGNTTLCSLDLSHNNIESADTVKLMAKAIKKKHSSILHVNLGNCSLGGGDKDALEKLLVAVKKCESLEIGHEDMDSKAVTLIAQFLGKKNALTSFSLVGARLDKENKKAIETSLVKNKTIEELCLRSNGLALPGILRNTKKAMKSLSRLTHLDLSFNSLPMAGAKAIAKFLENSECSLTTLILSKNNLTTKGANVLLPALKENISLEVLDLSRNWLSNAVAPAVIDLLLNNSTLLCLDLTGNKSLKSNQKEQRRWNREERRAETIRPMQERGKAEIVKTALFDTTSLETIANSNHTCAVYLSGQNSRGICEETIRKINELDVSEGAKIRYKVVLAITETNTDLYDPRSFNDVPLELMPLLLELAQQELGVNGLGKDFLPPSKMRKDRGQTTWDYYTPGLQWSERRKYIPDPSLTNVYEIIMGWQSLPLLFVNGAGELPKKKVVKPTKTRKRPRKFGEEDDSDDEPYIPKGARKTGRWETQTVRQADGSLRRKYVFIPPPVY